MIRSRLPWFVAMLAGAALIGGCGSGSTHSSATATGTSSTAPATSTASSTTAPSLTSATPKTTSTGTQSNDRGPAKAEIAACERGLGTLPARFRQKIAADCVKAAHGERAALKQDARELCEEVVRTSQIPAGLERERALALCKGK